MKKNHSALSATSVILLGEIIVSLIIVGIYLLIDKFTYKVVTGVVLGSAVTVLNFLFLSISTNRVIDRFLLARGDKEMDEEEAGTFAAKYQGEIQNSVKLSFIIRTVTMLAALVVAFVLDYFDVIATLVPLVMLRPIITVQNLIKGRKKV